MNGFRKSLHIILFATAMFAFQGCEQISDWIPDVNIFSDQDDMNLGSQLVNEINADTKTYPVWNDLNSASVKYYLNHTILPEILKSNKIEKDSIYKYNINIIKDTILNAFALPGGPIYVYTGLLKYLDSEAALAGVIGHEVAHAERRHASQRMTRQYGIQVLLSLILGNNPSELAQLSANLFVGFAFLANSRVNEDESDDYSIKYLYGSKYYPGSVKFFFEKMRDDGLLNGGGGKVADFLSTHPNPLDRITTANTRIQALGLDVISFNYTGSGFNLYRTEYQNNVRSKVP